MSLLCQSDLLNFRLHDFTRTVWVSEEWKEKISRLSRVWQKIERNRNSALIFVRPEELVDVTKEVKLNGNTTIILQNQTQAEDYSQTSIPFNGKSLIYRVAIDKPWRDSQWREAFGSDDLIGEMLGYPSCCRAFFREVWNKQDLIDTTLSMRGKLSNPLNNILLRWLGIRLVSHLPCSHDCKQTRVIAQQNIELAYKLHLGKEIEEILELLAMSVKYSALHGIAEITTPFSKTMTRTDATKSEWKIQTDDLSLLWKLNGFKDLQSMNTAHQVILDAIGYIGPDTLVTDLGCGNGLLLSKIRDKFKCNIVGVDNNSIAIRYAEQHFNIPIINANISDHDKWKDLKSTIILISQNRFEEGFKLPVDVYVGSVIIYTYDNKKLDVPDGWDYYYRTDNYICLRKQ